MASKTAEIYLDVRVDCTARMVRNNYGVSGSPVWYEPEDIECDETVEIEGVRVKLSVLPKELQDIICDRASSAVDDEHGWEK